MTPVVLPVLVGFLVIVAAIYFSIMNGLLRNPTAKDDWLFANTSVGLAAAAAGPVGVGYLDGATPTPVAAMAAVPVATVTGPVGVGWMDEEDPAPAPVPAPREWASAPVGGPVGVGWMDEEDPAPAATPALLTAPAPVRDWPSAPADGPVGLGYMDV